MLNAYTLRSNCCFPAQALKPQFTFSVPSMEPGVKVHNWSYKDVTGASLVVQRLRICLPMQGTRVRAPVREDPTCHGAAGPVSHDY